MGWSSRKLLKRSTSADDPEAPNARCSDNFVQTTHGLCIFGGKKKSV